MQCAQEVCFMYMDELTRCTKILSALHANKKNGITKNKIILMSIGLDTVRHSTRETKSD
jgi:hypothetical protein